MMPFNLLSVLSAAVLGCNQGAGGTPRSLSGSQWALLSPTALKQTQRSMHGNVQRIDR